MGLVRNIKKDMENYLLQHKIVALQIVMEDIDPTNKGKKNTWKLHMYFLSVAKGKRKKRERE